MSTPETTRTKKIPFDVEMALEGLREAVGPLPKSSMFDHIRSGYTSIFEILIACVISARTNDKIARECVRRFFAVARTPARVLSLPEAEIDRLIAPATFHEQKAVTIREIARRTIRYFKGELPAHANTLQSFPGVGPTCAHMAVRISKGDLFEGADEHIHRVVRRWGYVRTVKPEATMEQLQERLTPGLRLEMKALLVPFGKYHCTEEEPMCSRCPLLKMCRQVGVTSHR